MRTILLPALVLAAATAPAHAQTSEAPGRSAATVPPSPSLSVLRTTERVAIDGRLDERTWQQATPVTSFTQVEPRDGAAPSQATEVRVAIDDDALYIGVRMHDTDPAGIVAHMGRRDANTNSDAFTASIDSYHDHRTAFRFAVNPLGVKWDAVTSNDADEGDESWDPVWDVVTRVDSAGWTAEMRIPLSQLRFSADSSATWGANFERYIQRTGEAVRWAWVPNSESGFASRFGHLAALGDLASSRAKRLEIMPYQLTQGDFETGTDEADPFFSGRSGRVQVGGDFKYGISNALTLNGTINPDFGQVEADAAEVNVTVFETFLQERRPFFVEGASLFRFGAGNSGNIFGAPQLFYSRRIGRTPSGAAPRDAEFVDAPEATRILGAAKLSGRVGGWSVGVLDAVTAREEARFVRPSQPEASAAVEPLTNYGVLSLRRDFRGGRTGLGLMGTSVVRDIDTTGLQFLRTNAQAAGLDFYHRFTGNQYALSGTIAGSRIAGDTDAIGRAQQSSARYFQRPDQDYMAFDPSARSLSGYSVSASGGKVAGRWLIGSDFQATSPGFEINDIGYLQAADRIFSGVRASHRWLQPAGPFRSAMAYVNGSRTWSYDGTRVGSGVFTGFHGQFRNYWNVSLDAVRNQSFFSDRATRGGPLLLIPPQWTTAAAFGTDTRRRTSGMIFGTLARNESGGYLNNGGVRLTMRPSTAITVNASASYTEQHSEGGYVRAFADTTAVNTFGTRYVMADQDQTTFETTLRADLAMTPRLSLQLYAQPFVSALDYESFKSFQRAGALEFLEYGRDGTSTLAYDAPTRSYTVDADGDGVSEAMTFLNPDFRQRSLRANLVLRWEYRAGSTIYLAWAHGRATRALDPSFNVGEDFRELLRDDQQNRLMLKVSYWFNP
ncbi:MAG TPA: DUF5916 domain-containing protein [Gemmatimonadaceae bacterium]|nr:DUF5916 domain-containing protein [Gemmatimonadaceae bacterium]